VSSNQLNNKKTHEQQTSAANVLIVASDTELIRLMLEILARKGLRANLANDKKAALDCLNRHNCDLVFITEQINPNPGLSARQQTSFELIEKIRANSPEMPIIMIADTETHQTKNQQLTIETSVKAIRSGCFDFLTRPLDRQKIDRLIDTFLPNHNVSTVACAEDGTEMLYTIVGKSAKMIQTIELAKRIAPTFVPVLISGEGGTGKELISYLIHHKSKRSRNPYIKVNCAALSDSLLESELFGHEKGAFTGAYSQRKGRFEMAHGGTLLLDEITETPLKFQAKLLRVLEQQDFERVGGNDNIRVDIRIISTTNKDLLQEVSRGCFRQDLYYRLSGVRLLVPPLRQHCEDLPDLVWHFVNLYSRQVQRHITKLDTAMIDIFTKYHWPGNVRQLRNVVLTSLILGTGQTLSLTDVSWLFDELQPLPQKNQNDSDTDRMHDRPDSTRTTIPAGMPLEQVERYAILDTLNRTAGNQTKAAKILGISNRTLRDKIHRYRRQDCLQPT